MVVLRVYWIHDGAEDESENSPLGSQRCVYLSNCTYWNAERAQERIHLQFINHGQCEYCSWSGMLLSARD